MAHRPDAVGMFWQDSQEKHARGMARIMPSIPETGWRAPREFPRIGNVPWLSIDTEGKDPNLLTHGPGWARKDGHICGFSIAVPGASWYFPMRHEIRAEENLDPDHCIRWLRDVAHDHGTKPVIGANLMYDTGYLWEEGVFFRGTHYDVQFAEALLEEAALTNLDNLTRKYLGGATEEQGYFTRFTGYGKATTTLYQWLADYYGGGVNQDQKKNFWRCPPSLIGPYAQDDASFPAEILPKQWARLHNEGLLGIYEMECRLIPLLVAMRMQGTTIDIRRAEEVSHKLGERVAELNIEAKRMAGFEVNTAASDSLQKAFRALSIPIPLHFKTGKPSFSKDTLPQVEHPFAELVLKIRKLEKVKGTFIESYLLQKHVNGKVHCTFEPLRGEDGGTRSGRFAGRNPNFQNMPARDEEMAPLVRSCFIPHSGHRRWRRYDYDQIEYRWLAHYAVGPGSDGLRAQYIADPKTDYHVNTQNLVTSYTRLKIPRKPIKNFNFGMTYGMGKGKMVRTTTTELLKLGGEFTLNGDELYNAYHEACPWVKSTMEATGEEASRLGYITTILGRRSRFDAWEPDERFREGERKPALPYLIALARYGGSIKRAKLHKALNRRLQGSAADQMKMAMVKLWESGVFNVTGVPSLTVHDELDWSDPLDDPMHEAWRYVQEVMETAIPARIPILASLDIGANWGECT